jgi:hypothetical protein
MATWDEQTRIMWGLIIAAVTGLYTFFLRHIISHTSKSEIERLRNTVQYKDNCLEIVKRFDQNHEDVCRKLDYIIKRMEQ